MISTIEMHGPATFVDPTRLTTDKKVNLIYGLNGTGKTTICRFLRSPESDEFRHCSISPPRAPATIYVYNEEFVRDNFYESETFRGIFSLSKENKEAEVKIESARGRKTQLLAAKAVLESNKTAKINEQRRAQQSAEEAVWKIKTSHTGGDRVLEYCLDGLKAKKESLLSHLVATPKPPSKPAYDVHDLKSEAQALSGGETAVTALMAQLNIDGAAIEDDAAFQVPLIGSQHTTVSGLIQKLGNSDWVREGLRFIRDNDTDDASQCPFCQASTITQEFVQQIREFFDESYEEGVTRTRNHLATYKTLVANCPRADEIQSHQFATDRLVLLAEKLQLLMKENIHNIELKVQNPSWAIDLSNSSGLVSEFNKEIDAINQQIDSYNNKLRNKTKALKDIKDRFWALMRWDYDQVISRFLADQSQISLALNDIHHKYESTENLIRTTELEISDAQRETINIDEAVSNINNGLTHLGIDDFSIEKHDENLYRLKRTSNRGSSKFATLSEGEKMIITLLYFCELCRGRRDSTDTTDEKIVVFDDPISSLSHLYIFNVGQLIRSTFFQNNVAKQVFVFTHSLYFFYELADLKKERRDENQALFRITKSKGQSQLAGMKYDEIQNDYQAYWQIVNDSEQHPALIANCMRNIVDYFFGFVEKQDFTNVFQKPALKENRFQAFSRYMNRESHSFGQNIYDLKEFNYDSFRDGLRLLFEQSGYSAHYKKMSKI